MPCIFNPGYIGPDPPCCDTDCMEENNCPNPACDVCPEAQLPCCSPARPKKEPENYKPKEEQKSKP
ncbi:uncharacterized protein Dana_GF14808 [Drosophila ananassae]|uniref:Tes106 n=1 Tax=Drosophila ananassae TaxID=7217 RepID=B3MMF4_DROAN|nr:uncharacterized protein LOC6497626 [Drosophila ananassae]EDV30900.1 uncharacterized protein Dana_GF14808 [Drosophila ananassae]